jgi:hypothetical protein
MALWTKEVVVHRQLSPRKCRLPGVPRAVFVGLLRTAPGGSFVSDGIPRGCRLATAAGEYWNVRAWRSGASSIQSHDAPVATSGPHGLGRQGEVASPPRPPPQSPRMSPRRSRKHRAASPTQPSGRPRTLNAFEARPRSLGRGAVEYNSRTFFKAFAPGFRHWIPRFAWPTRSGSRQAPARCLAANHERSDVRDCVAENVSPEYYFARSGLPECWQSVVLRDRRVPSRIISDGD